MPNNETIFRLGKTIVRTLVLSALLALFAATTPYAAEGKIQKYDLNIPREQLDGALSDLSRVTGLQIARMSDEGPRVGEVGPLRGKYAADTALKILLQDTGLRYEFVSDRMVKIYSPQNVLQAKRARDSSQRSAAGEGANNGANSGREKAERSFSGPFQVAQAAPRPAQGNASLSVGEGDSASGTSAATLGEIVVTAQKRSERLQRVPISISVLTAQAMDRSTAQGVSEALNAVPGVATTETYIGGGTNIEIRGVGASFPLFTGPSAVAYYLDSVPFGLVKSAIGPDANAYDLARVEVLRGPQGTLYGASALNGVVRILTNDADLQELDVKARVSGSGTEEGGANYRGDATVNVPLLRDRLAARATVGYQHDSGWISQPNDRHANFTDIPTYRLKVNAQPTDNLSVALSAWRSKQDSGAPDLGHAFDANSSLLYQPTSTDYDAYGLKVGYRLPWFTITSASSYLDYENDSVLGLDIPGFGIPGSTYYTQLKSRVASEEINVNSSTDGLWRWSFGGIYRHGIEDLYEVFTVIPFPPPYSVDTSKSYAVYGELTRTFFHDTLEVTGGARHFHDDLSQRGNMGPGTPYLYAISTAEANTPRVVVAWHPKEHLMLYTSYSQGFRSGFPQQTSVLVALPQFPPVRPDRLRNYEVGTKGSTMGGRVAFDLSVYHMDWNDIQLLLAVPVNGLPYPGVVNGARAKGNGVDVSLTLEPAEGLTISPYVSWNNLAIQGDVLSATTVLYHDGDRPSGSPSTTAGLSAAYGFPLGSSGMRGSILASANYTSPLAYRSAGATGVLIQDSNSVVVTHLSLAVDFLDHWTVRLYGDNLNNWRGTTAIMFAGVVPDWQARIRPLTVGVQAEYHLH